MKTPSKSSRRIRPRLLILLWIWSACMFTVVDLFLTVDEFDGVRPRAPLYRGMRIAAHKMVGEPYYDFAEDAAPMPRAPGQPDVAPGDPDELQRALDDVYRLRDKRDFGALRARARTAADARVRIAALRGLVAVSQWRSRAVLTEVTYDGDETDKVRIEAARLIGRTGEYALGRLDELVAADLPERVRCGAVLGLGELGDRVATERLLALLEGPVSRVRIAALDALQHVSRPDAAELLAEKAGDAGLPADVRAAACRALARTKSSDVEALTAILADRTAPAVVRAEAVATLGRLRCPQALEQVNQACSDSDRAVARLARIARTRLQHVQVR